MAMIDNIQQWVRDAVKVHNPSSTTLQHYQMGGDTGKVIPGPVNYAGDNMLGLVDGKKPVGLESGEFVIPVEVKEFYGTKFFDQLIQKAKQAQDSGKTAQAGSVMPNTPMNAQNSPVLPQGAKGYEEGGAITGYSEPALKGYSTPAPVGQSTVAPVGYSTPAPMGQSSAPKMGYSATPNALKNYMGGGVIPSYQEGGDTINVKPEDYKFAEDLPKEGVNVTGTPNPAMPRQGGVIPELRPEQRATPELPVQAKPEVIPLGRNMATSQVTPEGLKVETQRDAQGQPIANPKYVPGSDVATVMPKPALDLSQDIAKFKKIADDEKIPMAQRESAMKTITMLEQRQYAAEQARTVQAAKTQSQEQLIRKSLYGTPEEKAQAKTEIDAINKQKLKEITERYPTRQQAIGMPPGFTLDRRSGFLYDPDGNRIEGKGARQTALEYEAAKKATSTANSPAFQRMTKAGDILLEGSVNPKTGKREEAELDKLIRLRNDVDPGVFGSISTDLTKFNNWDQFIAYHVSDPKMASLKSIVIANVERLGSIYNNGQAATSDMKMNMAKELLDTSLSKTAFKAVIDQHKSSIVNTLNEYSTVNPIGGGQSNQVIPNTGQPQTLRVKRADGAIGEIPASRLQDYLANGYTQVQ